MKSRERIRTGFEQMTERKVLFLLPAVWLLVFGMAAYMGKNALQNMGSPFASDLFGFIFVIMAAEIAVVGVCAIMSLAGTPLGATQIEKELTKAGFADETGESPMLLSRRKNGKGVTLL